MSSLKLYYVPMTRSTRPRWVLEELGVPHELVRLDPAKQENRSPEYLKLNPLGKVPTLVDGDTVIFESAAICMHLADRFPEGRLAPAIGTPDRARYYQWCVFAMSELDAPLNTIFQHRVRLPEAKRSTAAAEAAADHFRASARALEAALAGREHLVGDRLTVPDILMSGLLGWAHFMKLTADFPALMAWSKNLSSRPAARRALGD